VENSEKSNPPTMVCEICGKPAKLSSHVMSDANGPETYTFRCTNGHLMTVQIYEEEDDAGDCES
jgi:hypothetical protein